jgi:hypothetical protein
VGVAVGVKDHEDPGSEAVANDQHTLYLIAEEQLRRYLAPFARAGSIEVLPVSHCEAVSNRGGCAQAPV